MLQYFANKDLVARVFNHKKKIELEQLTITMNIIQVFVVCITTVTASNPFCNFVCGGTSAAARKMEVEAAAKLRIVEEKEAYVTAALASVEFNATAVLTSAQEKLQEAETFTKQKRGEVVEALSSARKMEEDAAAKLQTVVLILGIQIVLIPVLFVVWFKKNASVTVALASAREKEVSAKVVLASAHEKEASATAALRSAQEMEASATAALCSAQEKDSSATAALDSAQEKDSSATAALRSVEEKLQEAETREVETKKKDEEASEALSSARKMEVEADKKIRAVEEWEERAADRERKLQEKENTVSKALTSAKEKQASATAALCSAREKLHEAETKETSAKQKDEKASETLSSARKMEEEVNVKCREFQKWMQLQQAASTMMPSWTKPP